MRWIIQENKILTDPSGQRSNEAALVYSAAGNSHSKLSRRQVVNHNISVGDLRAAVKRLQQPICLLLTLVAEDSGRSLLATGDALYIVGTHVAEQATNDTARTWAEIQVCSLLPLTWTMRARVSRAHQFYSDQN